MKQMVRWYWNLICKCDNVVHILMWNYKKSLHAAEIFQSATVCGLNCCWLNSFEKKEKKTTMSKSSIIRCLIGILLIKICASGFIRDFRQHPNWPTSIEHLCGDTGDFRISGKFVANMNRVSRLSNHRRFLLQILISISVSFSWNEFCIGGQTAALGQFPW